MCHNDVIADWLLHMYDLLVGSMHNDALFALMNGPIRKKLGVIPSHVTWGGIMSGSLVGFFVLKYQHHSVKMHSSLNERNGTANCFMDVQILLRKALELIDVLAIMIRLKVNHFCMCSI